MFFGSIGVGFLNYLFYPLMVRFLAKADYASLIAITSILNLIAVPTISLNTVVTRFTADYRVRQEEVKIKSLFLRLTRMTLLISLAIAAIIVLFSGPILSFLKIDSQQVPWYLALLLVTNLIITIPYGILQGLLKFHFFVLSNSVVALSRLTLSPLLVLAGLGLDGALGGMLIGFVFAYFVALAPLVSILRKKEDHARIALREVIWYTLPTTLAILGLTAFVTTDILMVNHYFDKDLAGEYSLGSVLGRIIIFSALPITNVMFPIISQRFTAGANYRPIFNLSFLAISLIGISVSTLYFLIPNLVLLPLGKASYEIMASKLVYFGIFATLQALSTFLVYFNLSIKKTWVSAIVAFFALAQLALLFFYHQGLDQVLLVNILTTLGLTISLGAAYFYQPKRR